MPFFGPVQAEDLGEKHDRSSEELAHRFEGTQDMIFLEWGIDFPIALLDAKVPVVLIAVPGLVFEKVLSNAQEAKARDAQLVGVAPDCPDAELLSPLLTVIHMQLLNYHIEAHRGLDVDQPRNLAERVTVECALPLGRACHCCYLPHVDSSFSQHSPHGVR